MFIGALSIFFSFMDLLDVKSKKHLKVIFIKIGLGLLVVGIGRGLGYLDIL